METRYVLVRFDDWTGNRWGRVVASGTEEAVALARQLLVPDGAADFAIQEALFWGRAW